jgi:hypothetical protein
LLHFAESALELQNFLQNAIKMEIVALAAHLSAFLVCNCEVRKLHLNCFSRHVCELICSGSCSNTSRC